MRPDIHERLDEAKQQEEYERLRVQLRTKERQLNELLDDVERTRKYISSIKSRLHQYEKQL